VVGEDTHVTGSGSQVDLVNFSVLIDGLAYVNYNISSLATTSCNDDTNSHVNKKVFGEATVSDEILHVKSLN
jgi:hypothetical protein